MERKTPRKSAFQKRKSFLLTARGGPALALFFILALLCGCAFRSVVKIKARIPNQSYEEIFLIPPREDPRDIVPKVVSRLERMGFAVHVTDPDKPLRSQRGSGFVVSRDGHVLTCAHVLGEEKTATVWLDGRRFEAEVIGSDSRWDLGLLKIRKAEKFDGSPLPWLSKPEYRMGQEVYTIGYPLTGILGTSPRLSRGLISSTVGVRDNPLQLQISAQVQPGNSGGPLLDENGVVIGIIQMTLNPKAVALRSGGAVPQNVNFAIKASPAVAFLKRQGVVPRSAPSSRGPGLHQARHAVARILAGLVPPGAENKPRMVARLTYRSQWDLWYRFNGFLLVLFDYDTGTPIFAAGQRGNNIWTTEESVLEEAFREIEKAFFPGRREKPEIIRRPEKKHP